MSIADTLKKQAKELEAKGAMRTKHEDLTLENLKTKLAAVERATK